MATARDLSIPYSVLEVLGGGKLILTSSVLHLLPVPVVLGFGTGTILGQKQQLSWLVTRSCGFNSWSTFVSSPIISQLHILQEVRNPSPRIPEVPWLTYRRLQQSLEDAIRRIMCPHTCLDGRGNGGPGRGNYRVCGLTGSSTEIQTLDIS